MAPTRGMVGGVRGERFADGERLPLNGSRGGKLKLAAVAVLFWVFTLDRGYSEVSLFGCHGVDLLGVTVLPFWVLPCCLFGCGSVAFLGVAVLPFWVLLWRCGLLLQREYLVDIWVTDRKYRPNNIAAQIQIFKEDKEEAGDGRQGRMSRREEKGRRRRRGRGGKGEGIHN